ncbi:hypothetical protein [Paenibacillus sinopodophylli]|uniref:hypothetical protein n=1 Tax=Paenibacillus sinopodophylli TaxID=1837342 RepID=UPI001486E598|nr:hypothetical protein [Paenibacillus sinopodophylli]
MPIGIEVHNGIYLVAGGICAACKKDFKHLYKLTRFAESDPRCSGCMEKLKK